jgi:hypothetical protein
MSMGLSEASPESFAKRAIVPVRKGIAALVVPSDAIDEVTVELRTTLNYLSVRFAEAPLDGALRARSAAKAQDSRPQAVLLATTSEDPHFWHAVENHRSRLEDGVTTILVLSEGAAKALLRTATNLSSFIGPMWATESRLDTGLVMAIEAAHAGRYPELYEAVDAREVMALDDAASDVLTALGDPRVDDRAWRRFGFMARAVLVEVVPTIAAHWAPGLTSANAVHAALDAWLSSASEPVVVASRPAIPLVPQALSEAMGVVAEAAQALDRAQARAALTEILDSIFQGYAIFPGSEGRRAIFDWWLDDVVPAVAVLRTPRRFNGRLKFDASGR